MLTISLNTFEENRGKNRDKGKEEISTLPLLILSFKHNN